MSDITPIGRSHAAALPRRAAGVPEPVSPAPRTGPTDSVELSNTARLLSKLSELPDIRKDLVDRVRGEIAAGTYDTPEKVDAILDKIAEDLV